jgi:hypothetical protein
MEMGDKIDLMVTHINPSSSIANTPEEFRYSRSTMYYTFDGSKLFKNVSNWVYGHQHTKYHYEVDGCRCFSNPIGYPHENIGTKPMTITI